MEGLWSGRNRRILCAIADLKMEGPHAKKGASNCWERPQLTTSREMGPSTLQLQEPNSARHETEPGSRFSPRNSRQELSSADTVTSAFILGRELNHTVWISDLQKLWDKRCFMVIKMKIIGTQDSKSRLCVGGQPGLKSSRWVQCSLLEYWVH